jgi:hypothetical protein
VTWLVYGAWMSLAYGAGRFLEGTRQAWLVAALVGLGPAAHLTLSVSWRVGGSPEWDTVLAFYVCLAAAIGLGVALFLCLLGRSRRFNG